MRSINKRYSVLKAVMLLLMIVSSIRVAAFNAVERYQNQKQGQIKKGDVLIIEDEKFENPDYDWAKIHKKSVNDVISFGLYRESGVVLDKAFKCELDLKVEYWSQPNQADPIVNDHIKLKINYDPAAGVAYQDEATYQFMEGYRVRLTVNDITSTELGSQLPAAFRMAGLIVVERSYDLDPAANLAVQVIGTPTTEVSLKWASIRGAEEYDLEWTFVDEEADNGKLLQNQGNNVTTTTLATMFRNNATRVTLQRESYNISLVSYSKYLLLRLRTVQYGDDGTRKEGPWKYQKYQDAESAVIVPSVIAVDNSWHQQNLNWQLDAVYSEEGKKKEVVSYFDGSLRKRQMVTVNNADNKAIVQETLYDEFGRPMAEILPAPQSSSTLKYYGSLHKDANDKDYGYQQIYGQDADCIGTPQPMKASFGAAKYYSPSNEFLAAAPENKYIPDAEGYPFAVTRYIGDNTGRVAVQGGVGKLFQPGVNNDVSKATRFYYSKPMSWELNRIFGNDVGYADHYLKTTSVDPNGQVSITYQNAGGKTIATALAGGSPDNVDALPSKPDAKEITSVIITPDEFHFDASKLTISATTTYQQDVPDMVELHYDIDQLIRNYAENGVTICSNCYYELSIKITNDCNEPIYNTTTPLKIGSLTSNCTSIDGIKNDIKDVKFNKAGTYYINFELRLPEEAIRTFTEDFINRNTNLRSEWSFINDALLGKNFLSCFNDCQTCRESLGELSDFRNRILERLTANNVAVSQNSAMINSWIDNLYATLSSECAASRATCASSPCDDLADVIKQDVSPGGQYALFDAVGNTQEADINVISQYWRVVFNPANKPSTIPDVDKVELPDGTITSPYESNFKLAQLVRYWKPEWAERFMVYHPEYCALEFCRANSASYQWDERLQTLADKISDIPSIVPGAIYGKTVAGWLANKDPFFLDGGLGRNYRLGFINDLAAYSNTIPDFSTKGLPAKTLFEYVDFELYCSDKDGNTNTSTLADKWSNCTPNPTCTIPDLEWRMYRDKYFELKERYYNIVRSETYCNGKCSVGNPIPVAPGTCPAGGDFTIQAGSATNCSSNEQSVRIMYNGAALINSAKAYIYYPQEYASMTDVKSVTFSAGQSQMDICIDKNIPVNTLKVSKVVCGNTADPSMFCTDYTIENFEFIWDELGGNAYMQFHDGMNNKIPAGVRVWVQVHLTDGLNYHRTYTYKSWSVTGRSENASANAPSGGRLFTEGPNELICEYTPTVPDNCNPTLKTKRSRIPSVSYDVSNLNMDVAALQALGESQMRGFVAANCEAQADNWLQQLDPCILSSTTEANRAVKTALLRSKLIEVCKLGGDLNHPFGATTVPNGQATAEGYKSFAEVIQGVLGKTDMLCNAYMLDAPMPFDTKAQMTVSTISKTNATVCDRLTALQAAQTAAQIGGSFYSYLKSRYGAAMTITEAELTMLQKGCSNCRYLLEKPIELPVFLDAPAKGCITKTEYTTAKSGLNGLIGTSLNTTHENYETIVTNYYNGKFGFTLSYSAYMKYEQVIATDANAMLCNKPVYSYVKIDPYACMMSVIDDAVVSGRMGYIKYIEEEKRKFRRDYIAYCGANRPEVTLTSKQQIYHYTLYYYDQAGNLVRTIPPEGVRLLDDALSAQIDAVRMRGGDITSCSYDPTKVKTDKTVSLQQWATAFSRTGATSMEMWIYGANNGGGQVLATTDGNRYFFNLCLHGNYLNFDVYSVTPGTGNTAADIVLSAHTTADISKVAPLSQRTHVVLQSNSGLNTNNLSVYVDGVLCPTVATAVPAECGWELSVGSTGVVYPENLTTLKHVRLYSRLMATNEIAANAGESCFGINSAYAADPTGSMFHWGMFDAVGIYPKHLLATSYAYQSLNGIEIEASPDGGEKRFWYDRVGRVIAAQDAQQKSYTATQPGTFNYRGRYSHTLYDELGRISMIAGRWSNTSDLALVPFLKESQGTMYLRQLTRSNYILNYYDVPSLGTQLQTNLRNRISSIEINDAGGTGPASIKTEYFSYDLMGNIKTYWPNILFKRVDYQYDLVSGKINKIRYQAGQPDQFIYNYEYDAENRLIKASTDTKTTSPNSWEMLTPHNDALYKYYYHGPLARTELGDKQLVQGIDYVYTLQGWLKAINGTNLDPTKDVGQDGLNSGDRPTVARDVYAYSLDYYKDDFKAIGRSVIVNNALALTWTAGEKTEIGTDLFNGNISRTTVGLKPINSGTPVGYSYRYDQLNRIKNMRQHTFNSGSWAAVTVGNAFGEDVTYDANGNILTYKRGGINGTKASPFDMDNLSYVYPKDASGGLINNRLQQVTDQITTSLYANDLKNGQSSDNYKYDEIGNLISDSQAGIDKIEWNFFDKIKSTSYHETATPSNTFSLEYGYDRIGNRVEKTLYRSGIFFKSSTSYVRDANGNVLAVYEVNNGDANPKWTEQHLYGSSRLGIWKPNMTIATGSSSESAWLAKGNKTYELTNHLGNVMATISDKRVDLVSGGAVDHYEAEALSAQDYYPYGMLQPDRQWSLGSYRYGFNGKENDNEIKGNGNSVDFGARVYDPRIGIWLSVDPLQKKYPSVTPYHFGAANPINFIDVDGRDIIRFTKTTTAFPRTQVSDGFYIGGGSSITNTVSVTKAPGKDVFYYDVVQKSFSVHDGVTTVSSKSTQFYPNVPGSAVGITQSPSNNIPFKEVDDLDLISLAKISPQWLVDDLVKKDPSYKSLSIARIGMKVEEGMRGAANLALLVDAVTTTSAPVEYETYYRSISNEHFAVLKATGKMPAGTETFISPTAAFSKGYEGVLLEFKLLPGTTAKLEAIGVRNAGNIINEAYPSMPIMKGRWRAAKSYFKQETNKYGLKQINIGLGNGKALEIFNKNISSVQIIGK
ncbi:RHS repeat-associated core domain-containing protein [Chitinophaga sp. YR627]|nr:RHS repeat-associated core domain-containing protein [Chitinophaga sp. YR627]